MNLMSDYEQRARQDLRLFFEWLLAQDIDIETRSFVVQLQSDTTRMISDMSAEIERLQTENANLQARIGNDTDADVIDYYEEWLKRTGGDAA